MIVSLQRITLFALISAIENDVRKVVAGTILHGNPIEQVYPVEVVNDAKARLERTAHLIVDLDDDTILLNFMGLGEHFQALRRWKSSLTHALAKAVSNFGAKIDHLVAVRNRVMHGRPLDFDDLPFVKGFCDDLSRLDSFNWFETRELLKSLRRDPSYAFEFEPDFEIESTDPLLHNLPSADFDDTGFVGRTDQLQKLKQAIRGGFPIITVLGDGGLGKTSLAVKAIYDLLDELPSQFDAVVWTSAKTTTLTATNVAQIHGAIKDSVGIFKAAASALGEIDPIDPMGTIRKWLSTFKILLIIDNLETILDERIRTFASEIPNGSKILFTTRVGLGAYDFPIELPQLSDKEGFEYFRRVCDVYGLNELKNRGRDYVKDACNRLNYSPLAIKWFVQAIRAGGNPASLLADPKLVLRYCVENVVEGLSQSARKVLDAMVVTARPHTLSSLHFILGEDTIALSNALRELRTANIIQVTPSPQLAGDDTYRVKQLANFYIRNYFSPSPETQKSIRNKQSQLSLARDRISIKQFRNVYNPNHIFIREDHAESDYIVADYLNSALTSMRHANIEAAEDYLKRANDMSPNYFEVHRVAAFISASTGNPLRAEDAYERAVSLRPDYAPLRRLYGGFLLRIDEIVRAKEQLEEACRLDDQSLLLKIELARANLRLRDLQTAEKILTGVDAEDLTSKEKKIFTENWLKYYQHKIAISLNQDDLNECHDSIVDLHRYCSQLEFSLLDEKHLNTLSRIRPLLNRFIAEERHSSRTNTATSLINLLASMAARTAGGADADGPSDDESANHEEAADLVVPAGSKIGVVKSTRSDKRFGFIREENGSEWFFHKTHLVEPEIFETLRTGDKVFFALGRNDKGVCATTVALVRKRAS